MNEKQRNQRERIKNRLQEIKTYAELCLEEFQDESTDTFYVDQKLDEISRDVDILTIQVRDYEDLLAESDYEGETLEDAYLRVHNKQSMKGYE